MPNLTLAETAKYVGPHANILDDETKLDPYLVKEIKELLEELK